jgi:hypothetical protein
MHQNISKFVFKSLKTNKNKKNKKKMKIFVKNLQKVVAELAAENQLCPEAGILACGD